MHEVSPPWRTEIGMKTKYQQNPFTQMEYNKNKLLTTEHADHTEGDSLPQKSNRHKKRIFDRITGFI